MDADTIRLILIVVGAIFLIGLYLWERSRESDDVEDDDEGYDDEDAPYGAGPARDARAKLEPSLGALDDSDERGDSEDWDRTPVRREVEPGPSPAASPAPARAAADPTPLLIQLSVAKRKGEFDGLELLDVADGCGLRPGDMDIFHCLDQFDDGTRVYFSMANMVKPGTFPFDDMEGFTTPGMMLFAQLQGDPEDLTILEEMIATARKIANTLGGDVLDETRRPLTVRKEEELRAAVLANEKRFARLARS
jgi:cell division protein ZipA